MRGKIAGLWKALKRIITRRSFLIKTLCTTLIACLIPLTILAGYHVYRENAHVSSLIETQLQNTTVMASRQFDLYISDMINIAGKLALSRKFFENRLSESVNAELDALDKLQSYAGILPYVHFYAVYNQNSGIVYTTRGKMSASTLMKYELGFSADEFDAMLLKYEKKAGFYTRDAGKNMVFLVPMRYEAANVAKYYMLYVISASDMEAALTRGTLGNYFLLSIKDPSGVQILRKTSLAQPAEGYCFYAYTSSQGFAIEMALESAELQNSMASITANSKRISAINIILTVVLIISISMLNYRPFAAMLRHVADRDPNRDQSEINTLLETYSDLQENNRQLEIELYEKKQLVVDVTFEKLLNGAALPPEGRSALPAAKKYEIVACARIIDAENTEEVLKKNAVDADIHAIEMYPDKLLVFICRIDDDQEDTLARLCALLAAYTGKEQMNLGRSAVFSSWDALHEAYLEARRDLEQAESDSPHFFPPIKDLFESLPVRQQCVENISCALRSGDRNILSYTQRAFEALLSEGASPFSRQLGCFQILEIYRNAFRENGLTLDTEKLMDFFRQGGIPALRDLLIGMLEEAFAESAGSAREKEILSEAALISFIQEHYTDSMFCLEDIAGFLDVSVYTASRIFKNQSGMSLRKYLNDLRIEHACDLLRHSDLSINDIALKSGFTSASYFNRIFKDSEGITPSNYRSQQEHLHS